MPDEPQLPRILIIKEDEDPPNEETLRFMRSVMDHRVICSVQEEVTQEAIKEIARLSRNKIRFRATTTGMAFITYDRLSENERHAWEQVIRGIALLF